MGGEGTVYNIINNYGSKAYLQNYEVTQELQWSKQKNEEKWEIPRSLDKNLQKGAAHKEALKNVRSKKWEESKMGRGIRWAWMQNYWMKQPCFDKKKS